MKHFLKGLLFGLLLCGAVALGSGCTKKEPVAVAPAVVQVSPNVASVPSIPALTAPTPSVTSLSDVVGPTTQLEKIGAVKFAPQPASRLSPAKAHAKSRLSPANAERDAYRVAFVNKVTYVCFERLYERYGPPTSEDIKGIDAYREGFATNCLTHGMVRAADVSEFTARQLGTKVAAKKSTRVGASHRGAKTSLTKAHKTHALAKP